MVRPHQILTRQLIELLGQSLGQAPRVHEDERAGMRTYELQQSWIDGGPDGTALLRIASGGPTHHGLSVGPHERLAQLPHVFHRHHYFEFQRLAYPRVHHRDRAGFPLRGAGHRGTSAEEARHLLQRSLGGRQANALRRPVARLGNDHLQTLQRQCQMGAALGAGHGMDFVDHHKFHRGQHTARCAGEHQIERLRGGDENVGRMGGHGATLHLRGVSGASGHGDVGRRHPLAGRLPGNAGQGGTQVTFHVVDEGLQRRDVQHPNPTGGRASLRYLAPFTPLRQLHGTRRHMESVERPQKRRQRLPGTGGSQDERVTALGNGGPPLGLSTGGGIKGALEPGPRDWRERGKGDGCEGHVPHKLRSPPDN